MPQLMPLNWLMSIFMILTIVFMMILIYDKLFSKKISSKMELEMNRLNKSWNW